MRLFDYLFYRTYSFYKRKKDSTPIWMGTLVLSLMLCFTFLTIVTFVSIIGRLHFNNNLKLFVVIPFIIFPIVIWNKYSKSGVIEELVSCYKDEKIGTRRLKGWLFISYLILVMLIPISTGYMRHNLGMDI
jgi:hypothetical protein